MQLKNCHEASTNKDNNKSSVQNLFLKTANKRRWSIINPGMILASAYSYFVFGQEKGFLNNYPDDTLVFLSKFKVTHANNIDDKEYQKKSEYDKCKYIKRRLRNSIAHCKYSLLNKNSDGKIRNDGDLLFNFKDDRYGKQKVEFEIDLPDFGNIVESAEAFVYKCMMP
ncbi:MAG: hypothetical protein JW786_05340 [Desulfobacterales bacterium]|nr:hypothetical protein [Desulfobacterales bacterium]